jgi:hypothetical protein
VISTGLTVDAPDRKIFKIKGGRRVLHIHGKKLYALYAHDKRKPADVDLAIVAADSWTLHVHTY